MALAADAESPAQNVSPRAGRVLFALAFGSWLVATIGDAIGPTLVKSHPLVLIAMNSRNRNLALATNQLDAVSYYLVGGLRLLSSDPVWYLIGFFYGDRAIAWIESRRPKYGAVVRQLETGFAQASWVLVVVAPNLWICLFAGAAGMAIVPFVVLNLIGTVGRLVIIRILGDIFSGPIDSVLDWIQQYRWYLVVFTISFVGFVVWRDYRRGTGELTAIRELTDEDDEVEP